MITRLFGGTSGTVSKVSVQVSEYSERNGGADSGTLYAVEVLFPDGKWFNMGYHRDLAEARRAASKEAKARGAELLAISKWPARQVQEGA